MTSWFQTDKARRLFSKHILVEGNGCKVLAHLQGRCLSKRAIVQGGFGFDPKVADDQSIAFILNQLRERAQQAHCVYVELRCFDDYSGYRKAIEQAGFCYESHYDIHIDLHLGLEEVWQRLHESKRRAIRKAKAGGQTWREADTEDDIRAFYALLKRLYLTKVHRPIPSLDFFLQAWKSGVKVLVVEQDSKVIGGVLMPIYEQVSYEWYICGGVMSTWAMIEWGLQNRISYIDMMGAGEPNVPYGVRDFKVQMGGELKEYGRYLCVLCPMVYRLGKSLLLLSRV